jgi:hypothetical protein
MVLLVCKVFKLVFKDNLEDEETAGQIIKTGSGTTKKKSISDLAFSSR